MDGTLRVQPQRKEFVLCIHGDTHDTGDKGSEVKFGGDLAANEQGYTGR